MNNREDDAGNYTELKGVGDNAKDRCESVEAEDAAHAGASKGRGSIGAVERRETCNGDTW